MEFATTARRRGQTGAGAATGASPARRHGHAHAPAAAAVALQTAWSEAEPRLRAAYAQALEAHAAGDIERAQQLYQDILANALLDPAGLQPSAPAQSRTAAAAAAAAALGADADETTLACAVRRLTLRSLALNNAAALAQQQADSGVSAANTADGALQQPTDEQRKGLQRSLQLHLDALEAGAALTQMRARLEREKLRIETGVAACVTPAAAATRGVTDASLWLRTARAALALDQLSLARTSLESAFQLRNDSWPVIDLLLDVLYSLSDWAALQLLVQHALSLDPWYVRAMLLQRHVWTQRYPDASAADSCAFAELDARLREQVQPEELEAAERHLASLQGRYNRHCAASFSSDEQPQLLVRRWDCTASPPCFAILAQQVVTLYAELSDLARPEDPLRTAACALRGGKFVPVQTGPTQQGLSLTLPVAFQIDEAHPLLQPGAEALPLDLVAPAQPADVSAELAAVPADGEDNDVEMADAPAQAAPAAPTATSAAAPADRRNYSLAGEEPAPGSFTYVDPIRECEASASSPSPAPSGGDRSQLVLQQKQQQRDLVLDVLRLGWTGAGDMRPDPAVEVDPVFFCLRSEGATGRSASPAAVESAAAAAAAAASAPFSTAAAASTGAAAASAASPTLIGAAAERLEVLQFLRSHALASATAADNDVVVHASSDLGSLALALLRHLHSRPLLLASVDPGALLCLVHVVHAAAPPAELGGEPPVEQVELWLFLAEMALEAHRGAHPNPLSGAGTGASAAAMVPAAASAAPAVADVIDLTAGSPSPPPRAPFRPPRRWKSRHPSALAVADHFLALLLLAQSPSLESPPKPAAATSALLSNSVPLQLRWSWLLAQRALAASAAESQQARAEQVATATAHLHRCVELFAAHRDVSSVSLAHLPRQGGALTRARIEQSLALLRVSQLIQSATRASLKGQHRAVLHMLRPVVRDAVAPASGCFAADSELERLPSNERSVVLKLLQSSAESERDHVALLLHALLSLRQQSAYFLSLMRAKLPIAKEHKQQAYDALDAVWSAWRKVGAEKMAACLLAMFQKNTKGQARPPSAADAAEHKADAAVTSARPSPYTPDEFFGLSLFRSLQSDIGVCMALALRGALLGTAKELMCQAMKIAMQVGLALAQAELRASRPGMGMHSRLVELHVLRLELHFLRAIHRVLAAYDICGEACGRVFLSIMLNRMYEPREAGADGAQRSLLATSKDGTLIKLMGECSVGSNVAGESSSAAAGVALLRPGPPLESVSWDELAPIPFDNYFRVSWLAVISASTLLAPPFFVRPVQQYSADAQQQLSGAGEPCMDDVGDKEAALELQRSCRELVQSCRTLLVSETGQCLSCLHGVLKQPHARHANTPHEFALPSSSRTASSAATSAQAQLIRERVWSFLVVHYRQQLQQIHTTLLQWYANQAALKRAAEERHRAKRRKVHEGAVASRDDGDDLASVGSGSTSSARDADQEHDWYDTLRVDVWMALDVLEAHLASQQLKPDAVRFIEQFLAAAPSAALEDCYRPVLLQPSLPPDQDDFDERLYRFYLGVVLPAFLQRTEDASRMAHRAGTSKDMDSMQASLQRIVRFNLLSDARSVVCWCAMAMMHWEMSTSQLYAHYADIALVHEPASQGAPAPPGVSGSLLDAPLVVSKVAASKQLLAKWIGDWFRFYRCAMLALHLLHTQHGVGAQPATPSGSPAAASSSHGDASSTLQPCVCCSDSLHLAPVRGDANNAADPACTHAHLAVELWEKVANGIDMLSTLARTLTSFEQRRRDAVAAASPAHDSAARAPDSAALGTLIQFLQRPEVNGVQLSFRCWQSAALVQDRNGLLKLLQAKAARKLNHPAASQLSLLADALTLSRLPRRHDLPSPASSPSPDASPDPAALQPLRKRAHEDAPEEMNADEQDSTTAASSNSVGVRALFALHFTRLQRLRAAQTKFKELIASAPADPLSSHPGGGDEEDLSSEATLQLLESYSFRHWSQHGTVRTAPYALASPSQTNPQRAAAVRLDVALAMRDCLRRQSNFYSALVCLAELSLEDAKLDSGADAAMDPAAAPAVSQSYLIRELRQLLLSFPRTRSLATFPGANHGGQHASSELALTPSEAAWWQLSPWSGVNGYFRTLAVYLRLLVRTFNFGAMLELATSLASSKHVDSVADVKRLSLYGSALLSLLQAELSSPVSHLHGPDADLFLSRACRVCMQLFEQGVWMRELPVQCYRLAMKLEGKTEITASTASSDGERRLSSDELPPAAEDEADAAAAAVAASVVALTYDVSMRSVQEWLSHQRWARSLGSFTALLGLSAHFHKDTHSVRRSLPLSLPLPRGAAAADASVTQPASAALDSAIASAQSAVPAASASVEAAAAAPIALDETPQLAAAANAHSPAIDLTDD